MIGAPWYLLAVGIGFVILGFFIEGFSGSRGQRQSSVHPKMRDEEIIKSLKHRDALSKGQAVGLLGYCLIGVSVAWRLVRYFV